LDEWSLKKKFDDTWSTRHYVETNDALHATIKINAPLQMNAYQTPLCGIILNIYKLNMSTTIENLKTWREGWDVLHLTLIKPMWVHGGS